MRGLIGSLGDVAEFINGAAFKPEDWGDEGARIIRIQNLTDPTKPYNRTTRAVSERIHVQPGDLLVSWSATLGVFEWEGPDIAYLNQHIFRVVPDERKVDKRYLRHALEIALLDMRKHLHGATMLHVNRGEFLATEVFLPALSEQRRIAAILDKADALRTKRREALAQLDRLAQSIFVEMFGDPAINPKGWPVVSVGDLLESASYGTSEKSGGAGEFPVLRMNNITRFGELDLTDLKYMNLDEAERERYLVKPGDVLFNRTNSAELVGKTGIVRQTEPMAYAGYLIRLRMNAENDPEYLTAFMNTPYTKRVLRSMCKSIIGMANINATEMQSIKIAKPPLELQVKFRQRIASLNQAKASHRAMQAELDRLFSSLQQRAFAGQL